MPNKNRFGMINAARPGKIVDFLNMIEISAKSNKVPPEELAAFLAPVTARLAELTGEAVPAPAPQSRLVTPKPRSWVDAMDFANTLSLPDLGHVIAVGMNRVDEALAEARKT